MTTARFIASALLAALTFSGCMWTPGYRPGGPQASRDLYTYPSTVDAPQSVVLVNTITNQRLWEVDVPIGQKLVVWFYDNQRTGDPSNPSVMRWQIMNMSKDYGGLSNAMPVPARSIRRLDPYVRTSPAAGAASREPITPASQPFLPAEPTSRFPR